MSYMMTNDETIPRVPFPEDLGLIYVVTPWGCGFIPKGDKKALIRFEKEKRKNPDPESRENLKRILTESF